jgi:hypothetical protein
MANNNAFVRDLNAFAAIYHYEELMPANQFFGHMQGIRMRKDQMKQFIRLCYYDKMLIEDFNAKATIRFTSDRELYFQWLSAKRHFARKYNIWISYSLETINMKSFVNGLVAWSNKDQDFFVNIWTEWYRIAIDVRDINNAVNKKDTRYDQDQMGTYYMDESRYQWGHA